ncbi:MAG TPA: hypothetical protein VHG93_03600 [Longimicrobium sp.]|nr:hypothetical protein [Longimicrobium sp.]
MPHPPRPHDPLHPECPSVPISRRLFLALGSGMALGAAFGCDDGPTDPAEPGVILFNSPDFPGIARVTTASGAIVTLSGEKNAAGTPTRITHAAIQEGGGFWELRFDARGRVTYIFNPDQGFALFSYPSAQKVAVTLGDMESGEVESVEVELPSALAGVAPAAAALPVPVGPEAGGPMAQRGGTITVYCREEFGRTPMAGATVRLRLRIPEGLTGGAPVEYEYATREVSQGVFAYAGFNVAPVDPDTTGALVDALCDTNEISDSVNEGRVLLEILKKIARIPARRARRLLEIFGGVCEAGDVLDRAREAIDAFNEAQVGRATLIASAHHPGFGASEALSWPAREATDVSLTLRGDRCAEFNVTGTWRGILVTPSVGGRFDFSLVLTQTGTNVTGTSRSVNLATNQVHETRLSGVSRANTLQFTQNAVTRAGTGFCPLITASGPLLLGEDATVLHAVYSPAPGHACPSGTMLLRREA